MTVDGVSMVDRGGSATEDKEEEEVKLEEVLGRPISALDDDGEETRTTRTRSREAVRLKALKDRDATVLSSSLTTSKRLSTATISGTFSLFGSLSRVFVQRKRKFGRRFCFGFIHFLSRKQASSAIVALNGLRVGGAALTVAPARFPRDGQQSHVLNASRQKGP